MNFENLKVIIKEKGCRMTTQRKAILEILIKHQDKLETVDDILKICQVDYPEINATTIYRNLELLDQHDLIYKMNIDRHTTGYKLKCMDHHHHHMICLKCGVMEAIDYCPISPELLKLSEEKGFSVTEHNLELYGYCKKCKERTSTN
jgi:Fur family zinc uptake transcriptional regulator/Fur family ferric uptake transcriptional regulator